MQKGSVAPGGKDGSLRQSRSDEWKRPSLSLSWKQKERHPRAHWMWEDASRTAEVRPERARQSCWEPGRKDGKRSELAGGARWATCISLPVGWQVDRRHTDSTQSHAVVKSPRGGKERRDRTQRGGALGAQSQSGLTLCCPWVVPRNHRGM